jgi:hypothetical protein
MMKLKKGANIMIADIITDLFLVVSEILTGLGISLTAVFGLLYDSTSTPAALTPLGTVVIIVVGAPLAWALLNYVISLFRSIRIRGGKR